MAVTDNEVTKLIRRKLDLPADTSAKQVMAALDTHILRRASAVGLPATANLAQVSAAEKAVAARAAALRAQRRIAAAEMLGHREVEEQWMHPSLRPVASPTTGSRSKSIDWAAVMAAGDL